MDAPGSRSILALAVLAAALATAPAGAKPPAKAAAKPVPPPPAAAPAPSPKESAIALYDAGRYPEARAAFEALDAEGKADGSVLYRLSFCQGAAGNRDAQGATLARAVEALEKETAGSGGLESWFYLANAYRNAGRPADAARAAQEATSRVETGKWPQPSAALDLFRFAKLYADQARLDDAATWYLKAVAAFEKEPGAYPAYLQWSHRFLGDLAAARMDWPAAEKEYAGVVKASKPQPQDWTRLAAFRSKLGRWSEAAEAWREAERASPGEGDDARYARQIALQAAEVGSLPSFARDGRGWDLLTKEELEQTMSETATVAGDAASEVASGKAAADPALRADLDRRLKDARAYFLAAANEYACRGLPIRETAFAGAYAPLVFHPEQWRVPETER